MNGFKRFWKLLFIADKEMFVLGGDVDTYLYLLFLRGGIYYMTILVTVNCAVLLPIYWDG